LSKPRIFTFGKISEHICDSASHLRFPGVRPESFYMRACLLSAHRSRDQATRSSTTGPKFVWTVCATATGLTNRRASGSQLKSGNTRDDGVAEGSAGRSGIALSAIIGALTDSATRRSIEASGNNRRSCCRKRSTQRERVSGSSAANWDAGVRPRGCSNGAVTKARSEVRVKRTRLKPMTPSGSVLCPSCRKMS